MVASVLALSLLGLRVVQALPAQQRVEERQTWTIGDPETNFGGGPAECKPGAEAEQQPCVFAPTTGTMNPPKAKTRRADIVAFDPVGAFVDQCPRDLEGFRQAADRLQAISSPTLNDVLNKQRLGHILAGCGGAALDDDASAASVVKISDRDDASTSAVITQTLQAAYIAGLDGLGGEAPSLNTWLVLQGLADQLAYQGVSVKRSVGLSGLAKRQGTWKLGCQGADLLAVITVWNALAHQFGRDPSKWPKDIFWQYYNVLQTLEFCGIIVGGLIPQPTIPGGPITPDPTVPGGPLRPDPSNPGGPLKPDPTVPGGPLLPDPITPGGGGAMIPDIPATPGGSVKPDPYVPGGPMEPNPTTPGGGLKPPKMRRGSGGPNAASKEALAILDKYYGPPTAKASGPSIVDLGDKGVVVIGWPTTRFGISP